MSSNLSSEKKTSQTLWWIPFPAMTVGVIAGFWGMKSKQSEGFLKKESVTSSANLQKNSSVEHPGRLLYLSNCARCHGPNGYGDGPESVHLSVSERPRDFLSIQWKTDSRPESIEQVLMKGVPGTPMAAFGTTIGEFDREQIVRYVASLSSALSRIPDKDGHRQFVQNLVEKYGWQWSSEKLKTGTRIGSTDPNENNKKIAEIIKSNSVSKTGLYFFEVWGVHCAVCVEKLGESSKIRSDLSKLGFGYHLLCVDEPELSNVQKFLNSRGITTPSLTDKENGFQLGTDLSLLPVTLLVDEYGNILARFMGVFDWNNPLQSSMSVQ
ncbi:MAG: hypothetical protein DWI24_12135 [Planctomycetota bacterium]|nr:MAG: hypothetical protein DWI24_12135 [Planctomycetota bacterium]